MVNSQHKSLKKLMQLWKIPPWLRDITPLLFDGEVLFCIPGYFCHKEYAIADKINCNVVWNID
jgi:tRNA(Ile)-lysidine synthase